MYLFDGPAFVGDWSFYLLPDPTLILPEFSRQEVEGLLLALLGHQQQNYDDSIMCGWSEDIDTIIDNLKPEKMKNSKKR
jgi:hypothetical protein